jgi:hypothetical protein
MLTNRPLTLVTPLREVETSTQFNLLEVVMLTSYSRKILLASIATVWMAISQHAWIWPRLINLGMWDC